MTLGGSCTRRWADDTIVSPSGSRIAGKVPQTQSDLPVPSPSKSQVHVFENLQLNPIEELKARERIERTMKELHGPDFDIDAM